MFRRSVVPRFCQHRTHWWPHWRLCFRRYSLYGTCQRHGWTCSFGCTQEQRREFARVLGMAVESGKGRYKRVGKPR